MNKKIKEIWLSCKDESIEDIRKLINRLYRERLADPNGEAFTQMLSIGDYNSAFGNGVYTAKVEYQRQYAFIDTKGGKGDKWQRNLMKSILTFKSLDYIWVNEVEVVVDGQQRSKILEKHIIDGGQRSRTIRAWFTNCIKLPKNVFYNFEGQTLDLSNKNWSEVQSHYPEFAEYWMKNYTLEFKVFLGLSNEKCSEIFEYLNDNNSMSAPEYRNSIWSDLATLIRMLADWENSTKKTLEMFQKSSLEKVSGKWRGVKHAISFNKRNFDDFVAKIAYITINPFTATKGSILEQWYRDEKEGKGNFKKHKKQITENLAWVNKMVKSESDDTSRANLMKAGDFQFLLHIKTYLEEKYTFKMTNGYDFLEFWRRFKTLLNAEAQKQNISKRQYPFKSYDGEVVSFGSCYKSLSSGRDTEIRDWTTVLGDYFVTSYEKYKSNPDELEIGFKLLDKNRSIKKGVKEQVLVEQGYKCKYYDWCGNTLTNSSPGDHSKTPHSDGGSSSDVDNCDMTCETCNGEKGSLSSEDFEYVIEKRIEKRDGK